jgi:hypothetical protein
MEDEMNYTEIVKKLVGDIHPLGETRTDDMRFENLKAMCELINNLVSEIDSVAYENNDRVEYSMKRAGQFAAKFLTDDLGIR